MIRTHRSLSVVPLSDSLSSRDPIDRGSYDIGRVIFGKVLFYKFILILFQFFNSCDYESLNLFFWISYHESLKLMTIKLNYYSFVVLASDNLYFISSFDFSSFFFLNRNSNFTNRMNNKYATLKNQLLI